MSSKTYWIVIGVIVGLALGLALIGGIVYFSGRSSPANEQASLNQNQTTALPLSANSQSSANLEKYEIDYTNSGFSPNEITIKKGDTVVFANKSSKDFWPASANHPIHALYSGTSLSEHCPDATNSAFDACGAIASGSSWSFTFGKIGTWAYHDHLFPNFFGKVIVK